MSARAVINTPREDREGDVIVPRGVHLDNYRNNPVVLWEHGLGELTRPIAKCQQPDGKLALDVSDHEITATSFFTDKCLESLQIFHLIAEGLVRATSVRALPIKSAIRKTSNAGSGIILKEWELIEWSWGALGVNPDSTVDSSNLYYPFRDHIIPADCRYYHHSRRRTHGAQHSCGVGELQLHRHARSGKPVRGCSASLRPRRKTERRHRDQQVQR